MLRGDASGRVPFALVAVVLLLSSGLAAMYATKLGRDEADRQAREARLTSLGQVGDLVHEEVEAQAQRLAVDAVAAGIDGVVNTSRIDEAFRRAFAGYMSDHFPRVVRGVRMYVEDYEAAVRLAEQRMEDIVPSDDTTRTSVLGVDVEAPDLTVLDEVAEVDRLAYFAVSGRVNYTLEQDDLVLECEETLASLVKVPAPMMAGKLELLARSGRGDTAGVGRTAKAILAALVQFRVLGGAGSYVNSSLSVGEVLAPRDVVLAVNFAILIEEVRRFRAYDADAAQALDAFRGPLPANPDMPPPPAEERTMAGLLETYAADGTVDAVDLFALYTGLDMQGLPMNSVFAQAIAALIDDLALKNLDFLGITPLFDWVVQFAEEWAARFEEFWNWLTGQPSKQVQYVHQFIQAIFPDTTYFGPVDIQIPLRTYTIPNGSNPIQITVPAHAFTVPFLTLDLLSRANDPYWEANYTVLQGPVNRVHAGLRDLVNDFAANVAKNAVLSGLLRQNAMGPIDPKDDETFLDTLGRRVEEAVVAAIVKIASEPNVVETLMSNLWRNILDLLRTFVEKLALSYDVLAVKSAWLPWADTVVRDDQYERAAGDTDFSELTFEQRNTLRAAIASDVAASGFAGIAFAAVKKDDIREWNRAWDVANQSFHPTVRGLYDDLRDTVLGTSGWLVIAGDSIRGMMRETAEAQDVAGLRAVYKTRLGTFDLWNPSDPTHRTRERFIVSHSPRLLQPTRIGGPWDSLTLREGDFWFDIVDPTEYLPSGQSPNVHYTKPGERALRPFASQWSVRVLALVRLHVETENALILGPDGLEPLVLERLWTLDFEFATQAFSGWNLLGVRYVCSDTVWTLILDFFKHLWKDFVALAKKVLEAFRKVLGIVMDLLEPILSFARKIVQVLSNLLSKLYDFIHEIVLRAANALGGVLDLILGAAPPNTRFDISLFGFSFLFVANGNDGHELDATIGFPFGRLRAIFVDFSESSLKPREDVRYDILVNWTSSLGPLRLETNVDPLNVTQENILVGRAGWGDEWIADFAGPYIEVYTTGRVSVAFSVPAGPGTVDIELGAEVYFAEDPVTLAIDLMQESLNQTMELFDLLTMEWEDIGRAMAGFAERLLARVDRIFASVVEASLYVEVVYRAVAVAGAGIGLRLVAEGSAIRDLLHWVITNIFAYVETQFDPTTDAEYEAFPADVRERVWVRGELFADIQTPDVLEGLVGAGVRASAMVQVNLPVIGRLLGQNWGDPDIEFGMYIEAAFSVLFVGMAVDIWILRGELRI